MKLKQQRPLLTKLFLLIGSSLILAACAPNPRTRPSPAPTQPPSSALGNRLQLRNFPVRTVLSAPNPSGLCPRYTPLANPGSCKCPEVPQCYYPDSTQCTLTGDLCRQESSIPNPPWCTDTGSQQCNQDFLDGKCMLWCAAKPVIYLYPPSPTQVDVELKIPGKITKSIPTYPKDGWRNVLALPSGQLLYGNTAYPYLFYESEVSKPPPPTTGTVVPRNELRPVLSQLTSQLGLLPHEQKDFLDYWGARLESLNTPYILISLFSQAEKDRIDKVDVRPAPETRIELLFHFVPLEKPVSIAPLVLPKDPPKRDGFTMVEWGGGVGSLVQ